MGMCNVPRKQEAHGSAEAEEGQSMNELDTSQSLLTSIGDMNFENGKRPGFDPSPPTIGLGDRS